MLSFRGRPQLASLLPLVRPLSELLPVSSLALLLAVGEEELFDSPDKLYARLQGYALGVGFAVIKG
jgi:hypothetical protein